MSEFRRSEITRCLNQIREGMTYARKMVGQEEGVNSPGYDMALQATSVAVAFVDLIGGMAADLNQIVEYLEKDEMDKRQ